MKKIIAIFVLSVSLLVAGIVLVDIKKTVTQSDVSKKEKKSMYKEVNDPIILEDNFQSGLEKWKIAINEPENRINLDTDTISQRVHIVDAPDMTRNYKAVQFVVPHSQGQFRSEIAQPYEEGFHERWYSARIYIPQDWVFDKSSGNDIVMQWHAVLGSERVDRDFPELAIAVEGDRWNIQRAFGSPANIGRDFKTLDGLVQKGVWSSWVIYARWSAGSEGLLRIWKDGKVVWEVQGPNAYTTRARTPYLKIGLYHPQWKPKYGEVKPGPVKERKIFITDVKIGNEKATYQDMVTKSDSLEKGKQISGTSGSSSSIGTLIRSFSAK
ncbi:polysaccharide lyase [Bacillus cereus group sp. N8]|uniref:Heparin lyase I family protein n=1 Tax=Bacillus proteolyticus TaxID=2026192 RepID=A0ABV3IAH0_9BACI|nr:polysaccharide lyase [Bacillus cereus group sp. N8]